MGMYTLVRVARESFGRNAESTVSTNHPNSLESTNITRPLWSRRATYYPLPITRTACTASTHHFTGSKHSPKWQFELSADSTVPPNERACNQNHDQLIVLQYSIKVSAFGHLFSVKHPHPHKRRLAGASTAPQDRTAAQPTITLLAGMGGPVLLHLKRSLPVSIASESHSADSSRKTRSSCSAYCGSEEDGMGVKTHSTEKNRHNKRT